ncbi:MAG: phospholipase A [Arcobacteraceae bacterium]|nr:phospholipase A [Arcobacteraceae bacterium]
MKNLLILIFFISFTYANEQLIKYAKEYEKIGDYQSAMEIYKYLALQNQDFEKVDDISASQENRINFSTKFIQLEDKETQENVEQMMSSEFGLYAYKKNYFAPISYQNKRIDDRDSNEAKFQISVRKPLLHNAFGLNESIEFGYTQTSWWQLYDKSSPFRETNYAPEIFAMFYNNNKDSSLKLYKFGFIHESNGKNNEQSRSWNRLYTEATFQLGNLFITPKVWYRIPERTKKAVNDYDGDDNPDIHKYYGFGELGIKYPYKKHLFEISFRNNLRKNNKHSTDFIWTFPLKTDTRLHKYFGFIQLQSGYGDSLIDHDRYVNRFTLGIAFSR